MTPTVKRLAAASLGAAVAIGVLGVAWEFLRFGPSDPATVERLEREVRRRFGNQTLRVESLARGVAVESALVSAAIASPEAMPALFERLLALGTPAGLPGTSATVYAATGGTSFRVLAWSDGPAEDLTADRLMSEAVVFVAPGPSGLRLVAVHPIQAGGSRIGTAAAELVLSSPASGPAGASEPGACIGLVTTSYGPVVATAPCGGAGASPPAPGAFLLTGEDGSAMLEVKYDLALLRRQRASFREHLLVVAALPLVGLVMLLSALAVARRNQARTTTDWVRWTAATALTIVTSTLALAGLGRLVDGEAVVPAVVGLAGLALAALVAGGWWWRPVRRARPPKSAVHFVLEHLGGGLVVAAALWLLASLVQRRLSAVSREIWQFPLFPFDTTAFLFLLGTLLIQIALVWTAAIALGLLAGRWRLGRHRPGPSFGGLLLWLAPTATAVVVMARLPNVAPAAWLAVAAALSAFGLLAGRLRRLYRHTTHAMRLVLLFAALAGPPLINYPLTASAADQAARTLIETVFAPAILQQPEAVITVLDRTRAEIDAFPPLASLIATAAPGDSANAYAVWSRTSLAAGRLTSEVELFGSDRRLVSRFALNVPEYPYGDSPPIWAGAGCNWDVFGEVARTGAAERVMLHAERGICDAAGVLLGAVVVHAVSDYRWLPFIASGSPYAEALRDQRELAAEPGLAGLQVAVYGWNDDPQFTSGGVAWPISPEISERLYASRDPFWTTRTIGDTVYAVHFVNDRRGFYALGYPVPDFMEHATRLAEITVVGAALLVVLLGAATAYAPLLGDRAAPLPALFHEVRTSFYRKLFLFFVLAAVGPVILLALAFGAYTASRIHADVESEAATLVTMTRRLFEEFTAFEQHPDQRQAPPTDALLLLIRQVTDQDVNLYVGPHLVATSQRDLFDSGLLPTRTPAGVYREVALKRLPTYVGEDRIGRVTYLVAAAPIPAQGRDAVISVPLGTRQQEIERAIHELNRRVLVGAVVVVLFAAGLGATVAGRVADPVARLTRAARQIAAGRLDVRIVADTADELRRLVDDFNAMTATLLAQRTELARTNQLKAWALMARQVAHEIKNPLTPIQLAAEHLQRVHADQGRPLGHVFDQCVATVLGQVRLLRQIASDFANFAADPAPRPERVAVSELVERVLAPYRTGLPDRLRISTDLHGGVPPVQVDRTLLSRALTNLVENALQAMPEGGELRVSLAGQGDAVAITVTDTGVGMDPDAALRAFELYFSTKTGGSGLGLSNAKRYVELSGGTIDLVSEPGRGTTITIRLPAADETSGNGRTPIP